MISARWIEQQESRRQKLQAIASEHLHIETLEERKSDSLDFHECSVWGIQAALEAAYELGRKNA